MAKKKQSRMSREEMIDKLQQIKVGGRIEWKGKTYKVIGVRDCGGTLARRDVTLLEEGRPETQQYEGKYQAAGKVITRYNYEYRALYAQPHCMDFQII